MKKQLNIRIILAAEPEAFAQEREELKAFVESLNDEKSNVRYELVTEEVLQKEGDAGQSFYLLVGEEFPEEESRTFYKVYDRFRETGAPVMYTYFRRKSSGLPTQSVKAFMTELDEEIGHFFSVYEELDSVKLGILLELARGTGMEKAFTVHDGAAFFRGREALSLENLPMYKENEGLQALLTEQKDLAAQFEKAAAALSHDPENRALQMEKEEISRKQKAVFDSIHKQEEDLCSLLLEVAGLTGGEEAPTSAQKLAIRELENGNYENAEQILRRADRSLALDAAGAILQANKNVLAGYVSENRLLIKTLMASGLTRERADEIGRCWEENLRLTKAYGLDPLQVKEYVEFLITCAENRKALEVLEIVEKLYRIKDVSKAEKALLYQKKGIIYDKLQEDNEAEKCLLEAVRISRELSLQDQGKYYPDLMFACHNLGVFETYHFGKLEQAGNYLAEAEEGYRKLCKEDPKRWQISLAGTLAAQGTLLRANKSQKNLSRAEKKYLEALEICREYAEKDVMDAGVQLSEICKNLAGLYAYLGRPEGALRNLEEALKVLEKMAQKSPFLYEETKRNTEMMYLEACFSKDRKKEEEVRTQVKKIRELNIAALKLTKQKERKKRKFYLEKALPLCEKLEGEGIRALSAADVYHNYSMLLSGRNEEKYRLKGWEIYVALFDKFPRYCLECIGKDVIWLRDKARNGENPEKMLIYAEQALDQCSRLPEELVGVCENDLVKIHDGCGGLYELAGKLPRAEELYRSARTLLIAGEKTEENQKILKTIESRLRNLYLQGSELSAIPDHFTEEDLDRIVDKMAEPVEGNPAGKAMLSIYVSKIHQETGESKYNIFYRGMKALNKLPGKKTFAETEWYFQLFYVLLQQLEEMNPGAYTKELVQMEEKIQAHHKKWKP